MTQRFRGPPFHGCEDTARPILMRDGRNVDLGNKNGVTPLIKAVTKNHLGFVKMLIEAGANRTLREN